MTDLASTMRRVALWLALWLAVGLFFASQLMLSQIPGSANNYPWRAALWINIPFYLLWAAIAPAIVRLTRREPLTWPVARRSLGLHVAASLAASSLHLVAAEAIFAAQRSIRGAPVAYGEGLLFSFRNNFHINFLTYWTIVAVTLTVDYYRRYRLEELASSLLKEQLARAELAALRMQLQPHFLFNTLNSISALVYENPAAADRTLVQLSDLLRQTLETTGEPEVPLGQEISFLRRYLEIQQTRFPDRLRFEFEIAEDTLAAAVPNLIAQPLVENAIVHGVARSSAPCRILVRSHREAGGLVLEVVNDGRLSPGMASRDAASAGAGDSDSGAIAEPWGHRVGLANTRARLEQLYGTAARLELAEALGPTVIARVFMPRQWTETLGAALDPAPLGGNSS